MYDKTDRYQILLPITLGSLPTNGEGRAKGLSPRSIPEEILHAAQSDRFNGVQPRETVIAGALEYVSENVDTFVSFLDARAAGVEPTATSEGNRRTFLWTKAQADAIASAPDTSGEEQALDKAQQALDKAQALATQAQGTPFEDMAQSALKDAKQALEDAKQALEDAKQAEPKRVDWLGMEPSE